MRESRASAKRPIGTCTSRRCACSRSFATSSRSSGVLTGPGQSALTRMFCLANCTPSSRLSAGTPPLEAVLAIWEVAAPITATKLAVLHAVAGQLTCLREMTLFFSRRTQSFTYGVHQATDP